MKKELKTLTLILSLPALVTQVRGAWAATESFIDGWENPEEARLTEEAARAIIEMGHDDFKDFKNTLLTVAPNADVNVGRLLVTQHLMAQSHPNITEWAHIIPALI